jgi:hypothetical protein
MTDLLQLMMETGLIQFGRFPRNDVSVPVQFHFDMLASYPDVLDAAVMELSRSIPPADRLVCTSDAVPLGVALTLKTGIPLVYSRGGEQEPAYDLVGAYDIGHPAVFITNVVGMTDHSALLSSVRRVGLDVRSVITLIDLSAASELPISALFRLTNLVDVLVEREELPRGQAAAVKDWLETLT